MYVYYYYFVCRLQTQKRSAIDKISARLASIIRNEQSEEWEAKQQVGAQVSTSNILYIISL